MGDRFGRWTTKAAVIAVGVLLGVTSATAQVADYQAPRTADESPDLNGIWQSINTANWNIEPHAAGPSMVRELGAIAAVPAGLGVVEGGEIPYRPEARAQRDENFANRLELDPEIRCYLPGVPRAIYMPFPFQIIQSRQHIILIHEYAGAVRPIYMDNHTPPPAPTWMGWSNGSWDGETLVVDSSGFNGQTWFDRAGNFHSDALHVTERFTARSADTLMYEVMIEDPNVFTRPWTMSMPLYRRVEADAEVLEFRCVEFVEDLIYGHLRKQPNDR